MLYAEIPATEAEVLVIVKQRRATAMYFTASLVFAKICARILASPLALTLIGSKSQVHRILGFQESVLFLHDRLICSHLLNSLLFSIESVQLDPFPHTRPIPTVLIAKCAIKSVSSLRKRLLWNAARSTDYRRLVIRGERRPQIMDQEAHRQYSRILNLEDFDAVSPNNQPHEN